MRIGDWMSDGLSSYLLSAYAAPLGMLGAGADSFAGAIPTILKVNSSNSLSRDKEAPSQALTGSVGDALRLGCSAIGFTIYPGPAAPFAMMGQIRGMAGAVGRARCWARRGTYR